MRNKKQNLIILFLIFSFKVVGQTEVFQFKIYNPVYFDSLTYFDIEHEFRSERTWIRENIYLEKNLFSGYSDFQKGRVDTFKVIKKFYYLKHAGKWKYFFSLEGFKKNKKAKITIAGLNCFLIPDGTTNNSDGKRLYKLKLKPVDKAIFVSNQLYYYIDVDTGVVRIESDSIILERVRTL